jgi:CHAD domain-containing protein
MSALEEVLDSPAPAGARLVAKEMLDDWLATLPRLHQGDEEGLHDYRVALRKLRSWLRTFDEGGGKAQKQLSALQDATGLARDTEVMVEWLKGEGDSPAIHYTLEKLVVDGEVDASWLDARTQRTAERLESKLSHYRLEVPLSGTGSAVTPFSWMYAAALRRLHNDLVETALAVGAIEDPVALHRVRIRAKRLRYALTRLKGWAEVDEAVALLKQRQDVLGELHDRHAMSERIERLAAASTPPPTPELAKGLDELSASARTQGHTLFQQYLEHRHRNDVRLAALLDVVSERLGRRSGLHVEVVPSG